MRDRSIYAAWLAGIYALLVTSAAAALEADSGDLIRWYVEMELPHEYRTPLKALLGYESLLGQMMAHEGHESTTTWHTNWEHIDYWFHAQFLLSPRRVHDAAQADLIVVPFTPRFQHFNTSFRSFMETAARWFPLLGQKPHILVLYQPAFMYNDVLAPGVLDLPAARQFTIITAQVWFLGGRRPGHVQCRCWKRRAIPALPVAQV
jgi:hypothetical protein